jgi:MFS transporter, DHA1 family, multidrug resistance protein
MRPSMPGRTASRPETALITPAGLPPRLTLGRLTVLLGLLSTFGPLSTDMYMPGLPALGRTFQAPAGAQLTLSACLLGIGIGQIVAGPLSDAYGRRAPLLLGLSCYTVTSALCALAPELWLLIGLRLIEGAAGGVGIVVARAVAADLVTGNARVRLYSRLMLVFSVAPILAPITGGQIVGLFSWRAVFVVLSGIGAVILVIVWRFLDETLPPADRRHAGAASTADALGSLLGNRHFTRAALASMMGTAALLVYIGSMSFAFKAAYGLTAQRISLIFALSASGMILGSLLAGWLARRVAPLILLRAGQWFGAAAGCGLFVSVLARPDLTLVLIFVFGFVLAIGLCAPTALALAVGADARNAGSAAGLIGLAGSALGALSAPLVGLLGAGITLMPMACVMAGYALLAATATLIPACGQPGTVFGHQPPSPIRRQPGERS